MHKHQAIADAYAGEPCNVYTLDGTKQGIISGRMADYAVIRTLDGAVSMQVNWPTVQRKMQSDKLFYAC